MVSDRDEYAKIVRRFIRRHRVERCGIEGTTKWSKHATQGREAVVYVDRDRGRVLKKFVVSLPEDPLARFEALERVNVSASAHGICPKVHRIYYELNDRGTLFFCIESDFFLGQTFNELSDRNKRKVAPLIRALTKRMVACGVWHNDLHGGNVLVSPDLSAVTFIDFGNGSFDMLRSAELEALALRKLEL